MEENNLISFDEFLKVDLRVVKVLEAEEVLDSNKLLKLKVSLGKDGERQIIAGIKKSYTPEELVGKQIVIVANLEPRKLAGLESQGMILAAHDEEDKAVLVSPIKEVENGNRLG
jgi:methionine--tRNA ligase beta chain